MHMESYPRVKYIEPLSDFRLFVIFDNGIIKVYALGDRLEIPAFQALKDLSLFNQVHVADNGYGVIWNDDIDLSEYELWVNAVEVAEVSKLVAAV